jgi:hypothetical protein
MKNAEAWDQYKSYTKDITEVSRKLGFAGAAICWVLKTPEGTFSICVLWGLTFFVVFFIADVLQSFVGALLLRHWLRREELKQWQTTNSIEGEYLKPGWLDYPSFALFLLKVIFLLIGFTFLAAEILSR